MSTISERETTTGARPGPHERGPVPRRGTGTDPRGSRLTRWDARYAPYVYISPFFVLFALVGVIPILYTAWVSVNDWDLIGGKGAFSGLGNYGYVLGDSTFWIAVRNTVSIFLVTMVPHLVIALAIAAALDRSIRNATFWRMAVLVPYVVAPVAIVLIFNSFFADRSGLVNGALTSIGLNPVGWHSNAFASHVAIATMVNFRWLGNTALILLAGMQAIPRDYYEAASVDGASRVRQFFSITIPQLRPTLIFVTLTMTIAGLQIFAEPKLYDFRGVGGPDKQWLTLTLYIYNTGWGDLNFGRAAAASWVLFLIIVVFGLANLVISRRIADDGGKS